MFSEIKNVGGRAVEHSRRLVFTAGLQHSRRRELSRHSLIAQRYFKEKVRITAKPVIM